MKKYSALIILTQPLDDASLDEKLEKIRAEIVKQGGTVDHITRMGRQTFARRLHKKDSGFYVLATFSIEPKAVAALRGRLNTDEAVFRAQITVAPPPEKPREKAAKPDVKAESKPA